MSCPQEPSSLLHVILTLEFFRCSRCSGQSRWGEEALSKAKLSQMSRSVSIRVRSSTSDFAASSLLQMTRDIALACKYRFLPQSSDKLADTGRPILTYERRACTKKGVKPNKHGIVYSIPGRPQLLKDEPRLGFAAVRLQVDIQTEKLAMESRVNYSKLVTVEHNVKVFFIGRIAQDDMAIVDTAVNQCWADKVRKENEGSHQPRYKNQHDQRRRDRRP